jgi:hypothetical protein
VLKPVLELRTTTHGKEFLAPVLPFIEEVLELNSQIEREREVGLGVRVCLPWPERCTSRRGEAVP